jgi:NAD/NADP transhydrogenase alpha subunit
MNIGLVKEIKKDEYRVGLTPASAGEYVKNGHVVKVEKSAGTGSGFVDNLYKNAGCRIQCLKLPGDFQFRKVQNISKNLLVGEVCFLEVYQVLEEVI